MSILILIYSHRNTFLDIPKELFEHESRTREGKEEDVRARSLLAIMNEVIRALLLALSCKAT